MRAETSMVRRAASIGALLLTFLLAGPSPCEQVVLVPYGSSGIRYQTFEMGLGDVWNNMREVFEPGFDDSGWPVGSAPFGASGEFHFGYCPETAATEWGNPDLTIVARVWIDLPEGFGDITTRGHTAEHIAFTANGLWQWEGGGCFYCPPSSAPPSGYGCYNESTLFHDDLHTGLNLVAVLSQAKYADWVHYVDFQILGDFPVTPVSDRTWTTIKALYRD